MGNRSQKNSKKISKISLIETAEELSLFDISNCNQKAILTNDKKVEAKFNSLKETPIPINFEARYENDNPAVLFQKGSDLLNEEKYEEALKCFNEFILVKKDDFLGLLQKAICLKNLNKYSEAIESYNEAIKLNLSKDPSLNMSIFFNKALCLEKLSEYEKAIECYNQVIKLDPKAADAIYNKAFCFQNLKKCEEAIACYTRYIQLNPLNYVAFLNQGICLYGLRKFQEALQSFDKSIELNKNFSSAYGAKGKTFIKIKRRDDALKCFEIALKLEPDNDFFKDFIARLQTDSVKENTKKLNEESKNTLDTLV